MIRCLAGARPGAKPRCDIDFAATTRYGRSARGSPEPSPAAPRQHDSPFLRSLSLVAYAYKFTEVYATRCSHAGPQAPLVRPRASRPPLYSRLRSLGNHTLSATPLPRRFGREHTLNKAEGCGGEGLTRGAVLAIRRRSCPSTQPVIDAEARQAEHGLLSEARERRDARTRRFGSPSRNTP